MSKYVSYFPTFMYQLPKFSTYPINKKGVIDLLIDQNCQK